MKRALIGWFLFAACGDDGGGGVVADAPRPIDAAIDAPPVVNAFSVSGTVIGPAAAAGPVVIAWPVFTGSPDYTYKFGDGSSAGTTFTAGVTGAPPPAARNMGTTADLGVGLLVLLPPGASLPEGMVAGDPPLVGVSVRHAIVFRGPTDSGGPAWTAQFPLGFSCGVCVTATTGFDTYAPTDCATLVIDTDMNANVCNFF